MGEAQIRGKEVVSPKLEGPGPIAPLEPLQPRDDKDLFETM